MIDRLEDRISAVFWIAIALLVVLQGSRLGMGSRSEPGPGFIFFWAGCLLALLCLAVLIQSWKRRSVTSARRHNTNWTLILGILGVAVLYIVLMDRIGFLIASFALVAVLLKLGGIVSWRRIAGTAFLIALLSYGIFQSLGVRLP
jgi:putative tricarboxylic transport membrane protein